MQSLYFLLIGLIFLLFADNAHAYLDPGTGSFIFQLALGALLGGIVAIKVKFKQLKSFGSSLLNRKKKENEEQK